MVVERWHGESDGQPFDPPGNGGAAGSGASGALRGSAFRQFVSRALRTFALKSHHTKVPAFIGGAKHAAIASKSCAEMGRPNRVLLCTTRRIIARVFQRFQRPSIECDGTAGATKKRERHANVIWFARDASATSNATAPSSLPAVPFPGSKKKNAWSHTRTKAPPGAQTGALCRRVSGVCARPFGSLETLLPMSSTSSSEFAVVVSIGEVRQTSSALGRSAAPVRWWRNAFPCFQHFALIASFALHLRRRRLRPQQRRHIPNQPHQRRQQL